MKTLVADLLQTNKKHINLEYANVQQQEGGSDCGVLAIAIATALCYGEKPESVEITQIKTREHLKSAFEQHLLTPFPSQPVIRKAPKREEKLNVYCYCRQIDDGRRMIRCDGCEDWFHAHCAKISPQRLRKIKGSLWFCKSCYKDRHSCNQLIPCSNKPINDYSYSRVTEEIKKIKVHTYVAIRKESTQCVKFALFV